MAKWVWKAAKNAAIGGASGWVSSRVVSTPADAEAAGRQGWKVGAIVGAVTGVPVAHTARGIKHLGKALESASKTSKALTKQGQVVFRRIRGRIVPVRVK